MRISEFLETPNFYFDTKAMSIPKSSFTEFKHRTPSTNMLFNYLVWPESTPESSSQRYSNYGGNGLPKALLKKRHLKFHVTEKESRQNETQSFFPFFRRANIPEVTDRLPFIWSSTPQNFGTIDRKDSRSAEFQFFHSGRNNL